MPRNGSGTYAIPTSFTPGTTISSPAMNANNADIGSELTNSLPRDGQAGMTGQFKSANGSVAAPGTSFGSDLDCGLYRIGADNIGYAIAGAKVLDIAASGLGVTGALSATGAISKNGVAVEAFASGTAMIFAQTAAPTGWTKGSTHNDKALRLVTGAAGTGGSTAFTTVFGARTIAQANLPNVNLSSASLTGSTTLNNVTNLVVGGASSAPGGGNHAGTSLVTPTATTTIGGNVPLGGSGTAMDFAVNYVDVILATKD